MHVTSHLNSINSFKKASKGRLLQKEETFFFVTAQRLSARVTKKFRAIL